ncbi:MmpS family transport accessory protein [Streptomyces davaonensis]|uniref:MmpS family transport accessory protein n=1 Tax=Streptomyces davaonensis TaxID=348043 RepID=UPI001E49ABA6|nr:MmpS family transport accessory protein [Streptomyces davaonensis]
MIAAGVALAACTGLVLYGVLDSGGDDSPPERRVPTASVTYEVTGSGTADITYQARSESGKGVTVKGAALPWRKTVAVPLGRDAVVNIVLGEQGGQARCTLTVRGQYVQGASASGEFGRATCTGSLPRPDKAGGGADRA